MFNYRYNKLNKNQKKEVVKMSQSTFKISLSGHKSPRKLASQLRKKYPDSQVKLEIKGDNLVARINEKVPTQLKLDIQSFLSERVKEAIHEN